AVSETIADKFRDYVLGKENEQRNSEPKGLVRRIFDRIVEFTEKLKNYLNDRGFKSVNDIFGEAYRGELAGKVAERGSKDVNYSMKKEDLESKPDVKVARLDDRMFSPALWKARIDAKKWAKENIQGKSPINKDTGWKIDITGNGIDKALSGERQAPIDHIEAVRAIPELIENSVLAETRPDRNNDPHIKNIHIFYAPLEMGGKLYRAKLTIKERNDGKRFYDHSLIEMEKPAAGTDLRAEDTFTGSASRPMQQARSISVKDLLKDVKTSDGKNIGEQTGAEPGVDYSIKKDEAAKEEQPKTKWQQLREKNKAINAVSEAVKTRKDEIKSILTPMSMGEAAKTTGGIVRENVAEMVRKYDVAEKSMKTARDFFDKEGKGMNVDFMDNIETGNGQVDSRMQRFADDLRKAFNDRVEQVRALGTGKLKQVVENYFPHIWKDPEAAKTFVAEFYAKRPFPGSGAFLKKRSIPTVKDGLAAGLELAFDNPVEIALHKMREMDKYIMAHKSLNEMKAKGLAKYVKIGGDVPDGWQKIDDKIATVFGAPEIKIADLTPAEREEAEQMAKITGKSVEDVIHGEEFKKVAGLRIMGNYYAPAEAARLINNYLSPGLRDKSQLFRDYLGAANVMNQFQLGFSAFHGGFITIESMASKFSLGLLKAIRGDAAGGLKDMLGTPAAPFEYFKKGNQLMNEWDKPTGEGEIGKIAAALQAAGGRARMDKFYQTQMTENMMKAFRQGDMFGAAWRAPFALVELAAKPIMEGFVPRMKLGSFYHMMEMEMKNNPNMSHEELRAVAGKAWDSIDNRMGQLVYDNLFWNKTTKDIAMATVRSVGWNLGSFREMLGGMKDIGSAGMKLAKGEKLSADMMTHRMSYLIGMPIMVGLMGAATQYLMTGKGPDDLKDYYFPKTGNLDEHGRPERIMLPSYMKDVASYTQHPGQTLANKLHPMLALAAEMLNNKDYYCTKIRNEDDLMIKQALSLAEHAGKSFMPFAARGVQRSMKLDNGQVSAKTLLPMIGITQAPAYINKTPAERMMSDMVQAKMPQTGRTQEQQDKRDLKQSIERQMKIDPQAAQQMLKDNAGKLSTRDRLDIMKSRNQTPLTSAFNHLGFDEAVKVFQVANTEEKQKLQPLLQKKYQGTLKSQPIDQRAATMQQYKAAVGR
ncbi:MAG: hypothetical protein HQK97_10950, partial [Nitrospirae bacterium]|nr:hypothetical protein [Nitrospirota bacterium]